MRMQREKKQLHTVSMRCSWLARDDDDFGSQTSDIVLLKLHFNQS